jgi:hypothetical protein
MRPAGAVCRWGRQGSPPAGLCAAIQGALGKINGLAAFAAGMGFVEFIGKDLFAFTAFGAFADKRFQVFEGFIAGTMLGGGHNSLLFWFRVDPG